MRTSVSLYHRHRFPPEIINQCVWLYFRFALSFRDVEEMLAMRGVALSYETVREWCLKFGQIYANGLRRRSPRPGDRWHLDEVFADATGRPDRFLALHFANEIWIHNIAEIMGHAGTDAAVYDAVVEFAQRIGMEPIKLQKEQPGYVVNSLLVPFLTAAQTLIAKGVADPETIDKTWRIATGAPSGPLRMLDIIGLNTAYDIAAAGDEQARANARYLKEHYIDQGKLGQASGEGFYKYDTAPQVRVRTQSK